MKLLSHSLRFLKLKQKKERWVVLFSPSCLYYFYLKTVLYKSLDLMDH